MSLESAPHDAQRKSALKRGPGRHKLCPAAAKPNGAQASLAQPAWSASASSSCLPIIPGFN